MDDLREELLEAAEEYAVACGAIHGLQGPWRDDFEQKVAAILAKAAALA